MSEISADDEMFMNAGGPPTPSELAAFDPKFSFAAIRLNEEDDPQVDDLEFRPQDMVKAAELEKFPMGARIMKLVSLNGKDTTNLMKRKEEWTTADFSNLMATANSVLGATLRPGALGDWDYTKFPLVDNADVNALRCSLTVAKRIQTLTLTDLTLVDRIVRMKGASLYPDGDNARIQFPGFDGAVIVGGTSGERSRVIKGGEEFITWHNNLHKTLYTYRKISVHARTHALFYCAHHNIKKDGEKLLCVQKLHYDKTPIAKAFPPLEDGHASYFKIIGGYIQRVYGNPAHRPSFSVSNTVDYVEYLLDRAYASSNLPVKELEGIKSLTSAITIRYDKQMAALTANCWFGRNCGYEKAEGENDKKRGYMTLRGTAVLPGGELCSNYGAALKFVSDSRTSVRHDVGTTRKPDAYNLGYIDDAVSSVPEKIGRAMDFLTRISGKGVFEEAHAWGTGDCNWWHNVIEAHAKDIEYYDKDRGSAPPQGGKFSVRNIEDIPADYGRGKVCFDDTFEKVRNVVSMTNKINAVVRAGYDGGFVKMYLGSGDEALVKPGDLPTTLQRVARAYERVALSDGGSAHSPEYYVVFWGRLDRPYEKKDGASDAGHVPVVVKEGQIPPPPTFILGIDGQKTEVPPVGRRLWKSPISKWVFPNVMPFPISEMSDYAPDACDQLERYLKVFLILKTYEMVRANIVMNIASSTQCPMFKKLKSILVADLPLMLRPAGVDSVETHLVDKNAISSVPEDEKDYYG